MSGADVKSYVKDNNRIPDYIIKEWHPTLNNFLPENLTKGSHKKIWFVCSREHVYLATINSRVNKRGCPYCSGRRPTKENNLGNNEDLTKEWNYKRNKNKPKDYTQKSNAKVWWVCKNRHEWERDIYGRVLGEGCPYCSGNIVSKENNCGNNLLLEKEWDYEENKGSPKNYTSKSSYNAHWICQKGHKWQSTIKRRENGSQCPYCTKRKASKDYNLSVHKTLCKEWDYNKNKLSPKDYTEGSNCIVWWICRIGHSWKDTIKRRVNGSRCRICNKIVLKDGTKCDSMVEAYYYLKIKHRKLKIVKDKIFGFGKHRYDFYIKKFNAYIEVTGFSSIMDKTSPGFWFKYLRNIAKKKKYVEKVLNGNFRFVQIKLNKRRFVYINKFIKTPKKKYYVKNNYIKNKKRALN